jgi:hypothetical protein
VVENGYLLAGGDGSASDVAKQECRSKRMREGCIVPTLGICGI